MALDLRLQQKLSQQLVMTPQLQQAIKLLQLNHLELADVLREELAENPVLEERAEAQGEDQFDTSLSEVAGDGEGQEPTAEGQGGDAPELGSGDTVSEAAGDGGDMIGDIGGEPGGDASEAGAPEEMQLAADLRTTLDAAAGESGAPEGASDPSERDKERDVDWEAYLE